MCGSTGKYRYSDEVSVQHEYGRRLSYIVKGLLPYRADFKERAVRDLSVTLNNHTNIPAYYIWLASTAFDTQILV